MVAYQEFMSKLNDETKEFVLNFLRNISDYIGSRSQPLKIQGQGDNSNKYDKAMMIALYTITDNAEMDDFFSEMGFKRNKIKVNISNYAADLEKVYDQVVRLFPDFSDYFYSMFETTPLELIKNIYTKYYNKGNDNTLDNLIDVRLDTFLSKLNDKIDDINEERESQIEKEIYKDMPIEVVSYLDCASKIYSSLCDSNYDEEIIQDDIDLVQLSLLLAVYYYDEHKKGKDKSEKEWIIDYLSSCGIDKSKILKNVDCSVSSDILSEDSDAFAVKYYMMDYLQGLDISKITISEVLDNILKKGKDKSRFLEKLLIIKMDSSLDLGTNFSESVKQFKSLNKNKEIFDKLNGIYGYVTSDCKEQLELSSKIYSVILKNINGNSLIAENDIGSLALFLSHYYSNPMFKEYLASKGIILDKINKQYGLNIKDEDVLAEPVNYELFINLYDRFLKRMDGNNKTLNMLNDQLSSTVFVTNILKNMAGIVNTKLWTSYDSYCKERANEENKKLKGYFCTDLTTDTIEFIEKLSNIYANLLDVSSVKERLTNDEIKFVATILTCICYDRSITCKTLESNGINYKNMQSFFQTGDKYGAKRNVDYKLITQEFSFIFKDGTPRKDINMNKIVKDAFKFGISPEIIRYFDENGIKINYENFDIKYAETVEDIKIEKVKLDITSKLIEYDYDTKREIVMVLKTYDYILKKISAGEMQTDLIKDKEDIKELSLLIGILTGSNDNKKFFDKRNISLENVLKLCGLTEDDIKTIKLNPDVILPYLEFEDYFKDKNDPVHAIFMSDLNKSQVLETITSKVGNNYNYLETEVKNGIDYEKTLSVEDRIDLLKGQEVETLDYSDLLSLLHFGDSLKIHSDYINDELPKISSSDTHDKTVSNLNQLISSVCKDKEQERKKGLLALFGKKEEKSKVVDKTSLATLKTSIDDNISLLSQEIVGYDTIRRYLEAYYTKNIEYQKRVHEAVSLVAEEVAKLDPKNPYEYAKFVQLTSILQVVKDKANRFSITCRLIEQQLLRINQTTASHLITINALETAKSDLFPLIGSEIAISRGLDSEKDAIEVTESVMNLFKSLLSRNIDEANANLDMLKRLNLPEGYVLALQSDLKQYSDQIESTKIPELPGNPLDATYTPTLSLEPEEDTKTPKKRKK